MKKPSVAWLLVVPLLVCGPASHAAERLKVVATLPVFADLVEAIGGEHVNVSSIASPKFDPHFIEPKPSDVVKVKRANLLVHGGLDLELWRGPLLDAAGNRHVFPGAAGELDLSQGIALLEVPTGPASRAQGDIHLYGNPHYWLNPEHARTMARTIADKLGEMDSHHREVYEHNLNEFVQRLDQKIPEWRSSLAPYRGREVIGYHREFMYLMDFAELKMEAFLEPKPGIPPTPQQIQLIERYISQRRIPAIIQASYFPQAAAKTLARKTGTSVILLCQNVRELPECSNYLAMMEYNVNQLVEALGQATR